MSEKPSESDPGYSHQGHGDQDTPAEAHLVADADQDVTNDPEVLATRELEELVEDLLAQAREAGHISEGELSDGRAYEKISVAASGNLDSGRMTPREITRITDDNGGQELRYLDPRSPYKELVWDDQSEDPARMQGNDHSVREFPDRVVGETERGPLLVAWPGDITSAAELLADATTYDENTHEIVRGRNGDRIVRQGLTGRAGRLALLVRGR